MTKRKRNRNPVLQKKYDEGFEAGFKAGIQHGTRFFLHRLDGLKNVKGIGTITINKVKKQLGEKYFKG